jgi:hypothetical protein
MFTINYSRRAATAAERESYVRTVTGHGYTHAHVFGSAARPLLDGPPGRRRHLANLLELVPQSAPYDPHAENDRGIKPTSAAAPAECRL